MSRDYGKVPARGSKPGLRLPGELARLHTARGARIGPGSAPVAGAARAILHFCQAGRVVLTDGGRRRPEAPRLGFGFLARQVLRARVAGLPDGPPVAVRDHLDIGHADAATRSGPNP